MKNRVWIFAAFFLLPGFGQGEEAVVQKSPLSADFVIATDVQDREPVGGSEPFSKKTEFLFAWTRIKGATEPTKIKHIWIHENEVLSSVPLPIRSSYYRTWSRREIEGKKGRWKVEVRDAQDRLIAAKEFIVK